MLNLVCQFPVCHFPRIRVLFHHFEFSRTVFAAADSSRGVLTTSILVAKAIDRPKSGGAVSDRQHLSKYVRVSSSRIRLGETRQQFRLFCRHELTKSLIPSAAQSGIQISQIQVGPKKEATTIVN